MEFVVTRLVYMAKTLPFLPIFFSMSPSYELEVSTNHRHRDECLPGPSEDSLWSCI